MNGLKEEIPDQQAAYQPYFYQTVVWYMPSQS